MVLDPVPALFLKNLGFKRNRQLAVAEFNGKRESVRIVLCGNRVVFQEGSLNINLRLAVRLKRDLCSVIVRRGGTVRGLFDVSLQINSAQKLVARNVFVGFCVNERACQLIGTRGDISGRRVDDFFCIHVHELDLDVNVRLIKDLNIVVARKIEGVFTLGTFGKRHDLTGQGCVDRRSIQTLIGDSFLYFASQSGKIT